MKSPSSPMVDLYADGAPHAVPDPPTLGARLLRLDDLFTVTEQCLESVGTGEPLPSIRFCSLPRQ